MGHGVFIRAVQIEISNSNFQLFFVTANWHPRGWFPQLPEKKITKKELAPCPQQLARLLARAEAMLACYSLSPSSILSSRYRHFPLRTALLV